MKLCQILQILAFALSAVGCSSREEIVILVQKDPGELQRLAAKEIRKYVYLRTGELPVIAEKSEAEDSSGNIELKLDPALSEEEFQLTTIETGKGRRLIISGGSGQSVLYGAYELAGQLGVRFYLHGDVIPDKKTDFSIPELSIHMKPFFSLRGILPFHDFPEGPDWWNEEEYKAVIAQLPKLKMNFIGFHCYPYRPVFDGQNYKAEPLVWIGKESDINADGTVNNAYPVLHFNTADSTWGYLPVNTSDFLSGASQLFETDNYGTNYMKDVSPWPHTEEENIRIFNESGKVISTAFNLAKRLGVKTCVGTETPLVIPGPLKERYAVEKDDEQVTRDLYKGIFTRIERTYHLDYYWLWTPEYWTWEKVDYKDVINTENDMMIAGKVLGEMGNPFRLATCGWVLGPPNDRTEFDRIMPKDMPFSCINRGLGYTPVDIGFASIHDRPKWSIPWMEDDPSLLTTQLWAGRMRRDAFDSWKYGCDGLMGIHWRTRILAPTVSSLAKAAWECGSFTDTLSGRDLPVIDFYTDFVETEFGTNNPALVSIFVNLDGKGTQPDEGHKGDAPLVASDWIKGPGTLMINREIKDIDERISRYGFLEELQLIRNTIRGNGNLERYDYWLNTFRFNKAVLETTRSQIELDRVVNRIKSEPDPEAKMKIARDEAIPGRIELAERWDEMNRILLSFVSTTGELGTIANLEMHNIEKLGCLTGHDEYLESVLKSGLPAGVNVPKEYSGNMRIIANTHQSIISKGDDFHLRLRVLSESDNLTGKIYYRNLGDRNYSSKNIALSTSHVFNAEIPSALLKEDFEYYIEIESELEKAFYPVTAGQINNVVVIN